MFHRSYLWSLLTLVMFVFAVSCDDRDDNRGNNDPKPEYPDEEPEDGPVVGPDTPEEMVLDIAVTDITAYRAQLTVTPSEDEPYACLFIAASQMAEFDNDAESIAYLVEYFDPAIFEGEYSEALQPLMPETEYMVAAFGYKDDAATTKLYTYTFTTPAAQVSSVEILDIKILKLFDTIDIAAIDPEYSYLVDVCECVAIVEATTSKPCDELWFWWYEDWMRVEYSREAYIEDLLMCDPTGSVEAMDMYYSMDDSDKFFFAGLANDERGATSELYMGESFTLSKDMCSPAEEFLAMVKTESNSVVMFARR